MSDNPGNFSQAEGPPFPLHVLGHTLPTTYNPPPPEGWQAACDAAFAAAEDAGLPLDSTPTPQPE